MTFDDGGNPLAGYSYKMLTASKENSVSLGPLDNSRLRSLSVYKRYPDVERTGIGKIPWAS